MEAELALVAKIANGGDANGKVDLVSVTVRTGNSGPRVGAAGPGQTLVGVALGAHGHPDTLFLIR